MNQLTCNIGSCGDDEQLRFEICRSTAGTFPSKDTFVSRYWSGTGGAIVQNSAIGNLSGGAVARYCGMPGAISRKRVPRPAPVGTLPDDLYLEIKPWPCLGRPPKHDPKQWRVTDDWPEIIPVPVGEIDVFEAWFGNIFEELFGPEPIS